MKAHPEAAGRVLDPQRAQESTVVADQVKTGGSFATRMRTNPAFDAAFENYLNRSAELAELAKEARERGDLEGAVAHLEEVVAMAPQGSDKKPRFLFVAPDLARLYIELDRPADAVKVLRSTEGNMVIDTFQPLLCLACVKLNDFANAKKALAGPMFVTLNIEDDDPVIPRPQTMKGVRLDPDGPHFGPTTR